MSCLGYRCLMGNITFDDCIKNCKIRCISRRTATTFAQSRPLDGKSITQLIMPTRMLWLMMKHDWYEEPKSFVAKNIGRLGHQKASVDVDNALSEERLWDEDMSGQLDSFENERELWDLKLVGSYKIKLYQQFLDGKLAINPCREWSIQLNYYKHLLKIALNMDVEELFNEVWITEPEGIAKRSGVEKLPPPIRHYIYSKWLIDRWIKIKKEAIERALRDDFAPRCRYNETWQGKRCKSYCPVLEWCQALPNEMYPSLEPDPHPVSEID